MGRPNLLVKNSDADGKYIHILRDIFENLVGTDLAMRLPNFDCWQTDTGFRKSDRAFEFVFFEADLREAEIYG
jgi:hypothetical protein